MNKVHGFLGLFHNNNSLFNYKIVRSISKKFSDNKNFYKQ